MEKREEMTERKGQGEGKGMDGKEGVATPDKLCPSPWSPGDATARVSTKSQNYHESKHALLSAIFVLMTICASKLTFFVPILVLFRENIIAPNDCIRIIVITGRFWKKTLAQSSKGRVMHQNTGQENGGGSSTYNVQ